MEDQENILDLTVLFPWIKNAISQSSSSDKLFLLIRNLICFWSVAINLIVWEKSGWCSGENAHLTTMWRVVMWFEFAIGSHLVPRVLLRVLQFSSTHKKRCATIFKMISTTFYSSNCFHFRLSLNIVTTTILICDHLFYNLHTCYSWKLEMSRQWKV